MAVAWEGHDMTRQHPVFVYGTLRPRQGNHRRLLEGRTVQERPCIAKGLALFGCGIPYAVTHPGTRVVGTHAHAGRLVIPRTAMSGPAKIDR